MNETFTTVEVRSTLRTLRDYLRDLLECRFEEFGTKLRLFVNFCEKDDVVRVIARHLHGRAGNVKDWFAGAAASGSADVPGGAAGLAHRYMVLAEIKRQGLELRNVVSTLYSSAGAFANAFAAFREGFVQPFADTLLSLVERIERELADDPAAKVNLDVAVARELEGIAAPAAPPLPEPAPAPAPAPEPATEAPKPPDAAAPAKGGKGRKKEAAIDPEAKIEALLKTLEATVKKAKELVAEKKKDLETDVKILKLELSKAHPNDDVVLAVVRPLERIGGKIAEVAAAIESRMMAGARK